MPRHQQPTNLWLRPARYDESGKLTHHAVWIIREGSRQIRSTGCRLEDREGAERALEDYLAERRGEKIVDLRRGQSAEQLWVADVLSRYMKAKGGKVSRPEELGQRVSALLEYWGDKTLAQVNSITCAEYVSVNVGKPWKSAKPGKTGNPPRLLTEAGLRRQLEDLRAAINLAIDDGICRDVVRVTLPDENPQREEWLTAEEVDRLIEICRDTREMQTMHRGAQKGEKVATKRKPLAHVEPFIRVGVLTGTRSSAVCEASFEKEIGRPWVDLDAGLFYRRPAGSRDKKQKRYPPVPLAPELVEEMRLWRAAGARYVVELDGRPVDCRKAFETVVHLAKFGRPIVRHTLRHTAATWMMQQGVDPWVAAGYLGMTQETLLRRYGHHHPTFLQSASRALATRLPRKANSQ
jgi:integrase